MFNQKNIGIESKNVIYVFIDASNLWEAQKAKGRFFDYERSRNNISEELRTGGDGYFDVLKDIKEDIWGRELKHRPK